MRLEHAVLWTLAGLATSGCDRPRETSRDDGIWEEDVFGYFTASDLEDAEAQEGSEPDEELCMFLCELIDPSIRPYDFVQSCTFEVVDGDTADTATDPLPERDTGEAYIGWVSCTVAIEEAVEGGRRPVGHRAGPSPSGSTGAHFAAMAWLEWASVDAFVQLAEVLRAHGAPADLVRRCLIAAQEEEEHGALMARCAGRHGVSAARPPTPEVEVGLFELAMRNAVDGCIGESWAAMLTALVAAGGTGADREAYGEVALEEARHGRLSMELHGWFVSVLPASLASTVHAARLEAIDGFPARALASLRALPPELMVGEATALRAAARLRALLGRSSASCRAGSAPTSA